MCKNTKRKFDYTKIPLYNKSIDNRLPKQRGFTVGSQRITWRKKIQEALVRGHDVDDAKQVLFKRLRKVPSMHGLSDDQIIGVLAEFLHRLLTGHPYKNAPGLQRRIIPDLTVEECRESILRVLDNREVAHHIIFGLVGDMYGEKFRPLRAVRRSLLMVIASTSRLERYVSYFIPNNRIVEILNVDYPLFGVDETLAQWIGRLYGVIGYEVFGFLDASKLDIIKEIDEAHGCNVFLDDLICGVIAAAYARLWTRYRSHGYSYEQTYKRSRELLDPWFQEQELRIDDLVTVVYERQSKYYSSLTWDLCKEGLRKVLSKSDIYQLLVQVDKLRHLTDPYEIEQAALTHAISINQKYGTVGNTNIGVFTYRLPAPLNRIEDQVLLYTVAAVLADTCGYVAHEMESREPGLQEVVQEQWKILIQ